VYFFPGRIAGVIHIISLGVISFIALCSTGLMIYNTVIIIRRVVDEMAAKTGFRVVIRCVFKNFAILSSPHNHHHQQQTDRGVLPAFILAQHRLVQPRASPPYGTNNLWVCQLLFPSLSCYVFHLGDDCPKQYKR